MGSTREAVEEAEESEIDKVSVETFHKKQKKYDEDSSSIFSSPHMFLF